MEKIGSTASLLKVPGSKIDCDVDEEKIEQHFRSHEDSVTFDTTYDDPFDIFRSLARTHPGKSFYLLNEQELKRRVEIFLDIFQSYHNNRFLAYAIKANPLPRITQILSEAGVNCFDCASLVEIIRAQDIFFQRRKKQPHVFYNNPEKTSYEIAEANQRNVYHFTADTKHEIDRIIDSVLENANLEIAIRINPDIDSVSTAMVALGEKFGVDSQSGNKLLKYIDLRAREIGRPIDRGVAMHIGSQNFDAHNHARHIRKLAMDVSQLRGSPIKSFNVGGGMPVSHDRPVSYNEKLLANYLLTIDPVLEKYVDPLVGSIDGKIILEPGRALVATSVSLMIPVNNLIKDKNKNIIRIRDGVFSSLSDAILHNWKYPFVVLDKDANQVTGNNIEFDIHGQTCDSGDVIAKVMLPENVSDDHYLWLPNAGAYHSCQGSFFNGMLSHPYIVYA